MKTLVVAEFAGIQATCKRLNSGEFSYIAQLTDLE